MRSAQAGRQSEPMSPPMSDVTVMNLAFGNRLGIAAGVDRTGEKIDKLVMLGCGHIEIGTVTDPADLRLTARCKDTAGIVGVNIGSSRSGISEFVLTNYMSCLSAALRWADYIVLNFSNTVAERTLMDGAAYPILSAARFVIDDYALRGRRPPLLAKVDAGEAGGQLPIPETAARILDGFVVAGTSTARLSEIRRAFPHHGLIAVGGIRSGEDARCRMDAGADLVQCHRASAENGGAALAAILRCLEKDAVDA